MFKRPLLLAILAAATSSLAACGSSTGSTTGPAHPSEPSGIDSISAVDLKAHVELLASDEYEGRATLKPGYEKAADYLVKEFKRYGLRPLPGQGSFLVPYTLDQQGYDHQGTHLSFHKEGITQAVAMGTHAVPFNFSDEVELKDAEVVFAGYGITAPEVDYDDYAGLDVKDKWVLIFRHAPGYNDPKSVFYACSEGEKECEAIEAQRKKDAPEGAELPNLSGHSRFTTKAMNAQSHGAKGMLLVTGPVTSQGPDDFSLPSRLSVPLTAEEKAEREKMIAAIKKRREEAMKRRKEMSEAQKKAEDAKKKGLKVKLVGPSGAKGSVRVPKGKAPVGKTPDKKMLAAPERPTCRLVYRPEGMACSDKPATKVELPKPTGKETLVAMHIAPATALSLIGNPEQSLEELQRAVDAGKANSEVAIATKVSGGVKLEKEPHQVQAKNVIGYLEGSDPQLKGEWIVVGGHFDHLGATPHIGETEADLIHNGADDNASGTSAVLELAQAFGSLEARPKRSILFMGFSGEEKGLLGSEALVKYGNLPLEKIKFMLNLDMIGRNSEKPIEFVGGDFATEVREVSTSIAAELGIQLETQKATEHKGTAETKDLSLTFGNYSAASDHHSFFKREVPVAFFFTGLHGDYHRVSDHADKLDYPRMETITKLAYKLVDRLGSGELTPIFVHKLGWLGASVHAAPREGGAVALVSDVEPDSRAQKAGLQDGDIITKIAGVGLAEAKLAGRQLGEIEPGNATQLEIERGEETLTVEVTRAKTGYLGVYTGSVNDETKKKLGIAENEGLLIAEVSEGTPAHKSGLMKGDIVIRIQGRSLSNANLRKELSRIGAGEKVEIQLLREGEPMTLTLVLGERPEYP